LLRKITARGCTDITAISRDELKQAQMRAEFPHVNWRLGDIRDPQSIRDAIHWNPDVVFHTAALKRVETLEENPIEAYRTNVMGTLNCARAAAERGAKFVFCTTDKAVKPINTYGITKALSERLLSEFENVSMFRWGNITGSRGSVVDIFLRQVKNNGAITVTHRDMTRFWLDIEDATDFMLDNWHARTRSVQVPPGLKASKVTAMADACRRFLGRAIEVIGMRPGEKIHEDMTDTVNSENAEQYKDYELIELIKKHVERSEKDSSLGR
jgi:UDP-N-acetylglucosamine 4,6-dehydratase